MNPADIAALIPHAGAMCLLDWVVGWDADSIHCRSASHRDLHNPLRRAGRLAAVHLIEYAAQATALHSRLHPEGGTARDGMLAGLREVWLVDDDIQAIEAALDVHAYRELAVAAGLIYRFEVFAAGALLASGRLTVVTRRR